MVSGIRVRPHLKRDGHGVQVIFPSGKKKNWIKRKFVIVQFLRNIWYFFWISIVDNIENVFSFVSDKAQVPESSNLKKLKPGIRHTWDQSQPLYPPK